MIQLNCARTGCLGRSISTASLVRRRPVILCAIKININQPRVAQVLLVEAFFQRILNWSQFKTKHHKHNPMVNHHFLMKIGQRNWLIFPYVPGHNLLTFFSRPNLSQVSLGCFDLILAADTWCLRAWWRHTDLQILCRCIYCKQCNRQSVLIVYSILILLQYSF